MKTLIYRHYFAISMLLLLTISGCAQHSVKHVPATPQINTLLQHDNHAEKVAQPSASQHQKKSKGKGKSTKIKQTTYKTSKKVKPKTTLQHRETSEIKRALRKAIGLGKAFNLNFRQQRFFPAADLTLKMVDIDDNRCPIGNRCPLQGYATITLDVLRNDQRIGTIKLHTDPNVSNNHLSSENIAALRAYNVKIVNLRPYPTELYTEHDRYIAELIIIDSEN